MSPTSINREDGRSHTLLAQATLGSSRARVTRSNKRSHFAPRPAHPRFEPSSRHPLQ
jgi:hypothetical protein